MSRRRSARNTGELANSAAEQAAALDDARTLALEISRGVPLRHVDAMSAGLILLPDETAYRWVGVWLVAQDAASWTTPSWTNVLITDQRLLCRCDDGRLVSLPWERVAGLQIELTPQRLVVNYGEEPPLAFLGPASAALAVALVAAVYGRCALLTHPALWLLRKGQG